MKIADITEPIAKCDLSPYVLEKSDVKLFRNDGKYVNVMVTDDFDDDACSIKLTLFGTRCEMVKSIEVNLC